MAENPIIVEEGGAAKNEEPTATGPFRIGFSKQDFADLYQTFEAKSKKPDAPFSNGIQGFALNLVNTLRFDPYMKDQMDYNSLRMGTAPILAELGLEGKPVTDAQIIELFAQDDKGQDIVANPSFFEGMQRQALPSTGFAGGFYAGMTGANIALAGVPPVTVPTAALRLGGPLVSGIVAGMGASFLGKEATDVLMGEEPIIVPGTKANYEAGKTFMDTLPFLLTPWAVSREGLNIGGQIAVNNAQKFIGPIIQGQRRVPLSARAVQGVETAISSMRPTTTRGAITTGFVETGALLGTAGAAREAERVAPDNPWVRFAFEAGGGVLGGLGGDLLANRIPVLFEIGWKAGRGLFNRVADLITTGSTKSELMRRYNISESELESVGDFIIDQLERNGEDPEALINALNDTKFDKFLMDENGNPIELDPATKSASVTLLALQNQFIGARPQDYGNDASARMKSSIDALRRGLMALYADGSETALQDAATIKTGLFEAVLDSQVASATNRVIESMRNVRGGDYGIDNDAAQTIFDTIDSTYKKARGEETSLWKKIPDDLEISRFIDVDGNESDVPNFISVFDDFFDDQTPEIKERILKTEGLNTLAKFVLRKKNELGLTGPDGSSLSKAVSDAVGGDEIGPGFTESILRATGDAPETTGLNVKEAFKTRGIALEIADKLDAAGDKKAAGFVWSMADALMADLNSFDIGVSQAYDTARSYSRAFNDVFTRAYAGDILGTKPNGAPRIPIEQLRSNLMKGDTAYLRAAQLDGIAQSGVQQALTTILASELGSEFSETGQTLLNEFNKSIDSFSGTINLPKMRQWYGDNKSLIESVPGLDTRIAAAMDTATNIRGAEEMLLRSVRANALNPDGSLNTAGLSNWMNTADNKRLLEMFPGVAKDLEDTKKAANLLKETKVKTAKELAEERAGVGLYELLPDKTSNSATAVSLALSKNQPRPFAIMNKYMQMIDDIGEDGFTVSSRNSQNYGKTWTQSELRDGMRKAIYDSIFDVASNGERFSPAEAFNRLFVPHPNGNDVSVAEWMLKNKLVNENILEDTKTFLRQMAKIELFTKKAKPGQTDEFFQDVGEGVKILAAMGGSVGGTQLRQMMGGGGTGDLIAAGRGARFGEQLARRYLAELPQSLQANRVQIVLQNEELLRQVLQTGKTLRQKNTLLRRAASTFGKAFLLDPVRRIGGEAIQETFSYDGDVEGNVVPSPAAAQEKLGVGRSDRVPAEEEVSVNRSNSVPAPPQQDAKLSPRSRAILEQELAQDTIGSLFS